MRRVHLPTLIQQSRLRVISNIYSHRRILNQQQDILRTDNITDTTNHHLDIHRSQDTGLHNTLHLRHRSSSSRWLWSVLVSGNSR